MALRLRSIQYPAADSTMPAPSIRSASQPLVPVWISLASCTAGSHRGLGSGGPHLLVQLLQRLQIPAGEGTVDPEHLPVAQPEDAAGFPQAGGQALQREHPAQPCQQHHGAHRTASLNLFSLSLFHPASPVFCAVPRCFFSIISHPRCNLPESRGECTSVPLAPALKTV